ncbi:protein kinase domain-containing protein [Kitasatospora purpeofusca]|uniref:non-specific serine/threonine protein kinase n=1 Tax=Kitasatospora purpeofusca TaxID=67352 RepID=A0ABZ1U4B4_9ACTN|nr:protein kinase [Kitasatospora purpeofusca]
MGAQDRPESAEGERLLVGRYELGERLGRGGMGTVWRARDRMLDREVAVKELTVSHLPEEEVEILHARMKREAAAAARIKHPGVITVHDVLEQDGRPWIVMELVDGRSLADVISQDGTLPPRAAAEVGGQVLAALHRGHQLGVLHRDVKPANVLLEHGTGRAVLLDFGIATYEGSAELTRPGDLVGSPDYLAPERAQGERPGPASDLWGLGATLYAAVEGDSPFRRTSPLTTLAAVVGDPLPEPRRAGPLGPVLAALMAKNPDERPSADEAARMLAEVQAGHTVGLKPVAPVRMPTQSVPVVDRAGQPEERSEDEAGAASVEGAEAVTVPQAQAASDRTTPDGTASDGTASDRAEEPSAEPSPGTDPARESDEGAPTGPVTPVPYTNAPARGPARRRTVLRVLALVVGLAVLAAGALYLVQRQRAEDPGRSAPTPTLAPVGPQPTAPADGTPAPSGYQWVDDPAGFRFPLPVTVPAWQRSSTPDNQIYYSPDNKGHYLQFAVTVGQSVRPLEHMRQMESTVSKSLKEYKQHRLTGVAVNGHEAAVWEFSYLAKEGGRRRAIEAEFIDEDGTSYAIYSSSFDRGNEWNEAEQRFNAVLHYFTPTR